MKQAFSLLLTVLLFTAVVTSAQPQRGARTLERLKEKLTLTKEQEVKIKNILEKQQQERQKQREAGDIDREKMREQFMKQMELTDAEIEKVLTAEQKKKFEEYKKERREMMQKRMREN